MTRQHSAGPTALHLLLAVLVGAAAWEVQAQGDSYIVIFKKGVGQEYAKAACAEAEAANAGCFFGTCHHHFQSGLVGFSGSFSQPDLDALLDAYREVVDYVEQDAPITITGTADREWAASDRTPQLPHAEDRDLRLRALETEQRRRQAEAADWRRQLPEQDDPAWNLDRIDQKTRQLDHKYHYLALGTGVNVYVLDTGIRSTHDEFRQLDGGGTRVQPGFSVFGAGKNTTDDCNGHGTHTAATIGGLSFGVAKNVSLWPVRAMDCDGSSTVSYILTALEWVANNHRPPAVLSMSVAGQLSLAINEAVRRLVETYMITVVVAAGNSRIPACEVSPGSAPAAITVGASDQFDRRWARSNWGSCVDLHAPGVDILSATNVSASGNAIKSGTSMACPHISGVVALYLEQHQGASPEEIRRKLNSAALSGSLRDDVEGFGTFDPEENPQAYDVTSTPNRLVYATLASQAVLRPGVVSIGDDTAQPVTIEIVLESKPAHPVNVSVTSPLASWSGIKLALVQPSSFTVQPQDWARPRQVTLTPTNVTNGNYHVSFTFTSQDGNFSNAMQTVKVLDGRRLTGDTLQNPRSIASLPFIDVDDTSRFTSGLGQGNLTFRDQPAAPDVCYHLRPDRTVDVDISTCGSTFDTKLFLFGNLSNLQAYTVNDDDPMCTSNNRNSRISTRLQAGRAVYIVVSGYSSGWVSAQGLYRLSITATSWPSVPAIALQ